MHQRPSSLSAIADVVAHGGGSERFLSNAAYAFIQVMAKKNDLARAEVIRLGEGRAAPEKERLHDLAYRIPIVNDPDPRAETPRYERVPSEN